MAVGRGVGPRVRRVGPVGLTGDFLIFFTTALAWGLGRWREVVQHLREAICCASTS